MTYRVTAPLVLAKNDEGIVRYKYAGSLIADGEISKAQAEQLLGDGLIESGSPSAAAAESEDGAPAKTAHKSEWVDYAVAAGYDRDEVEAMTKADIQDLDFG